MMNLTASFSSGYGDLSSTNALEMVYSIAVMVAGQVLFGFVLGGIASTLANSDKPRVLFEDKFNALKVTSINNQIYIFNVNT